jgi:ABC-type glutathione transport system ATPase component
MLVSTHDIRMVAELFPRMILMDEGLIVADGDTEKILSDDKFLNEHGLEKPLGGVNNSKNLIVGQDGQYLCNCCTEWLQSHEFVN